AELHAALEHPHDLLVRMLMRLDVHARRDAPPHDHALLAGHDPARDLVGDALLGNRRKRTEAGEFRHEVPSPAVHAPHPRPPAPRSGGPPAGESATKT